VQESKSQAKMSGTQKLQLSSSTRNTKA
jgi:hypothetical protein